MQKYQKICVCTNLKICLLLIFFELDFFELDFSVCFEVMISQSLSLDLTQGYGYDESASIKKPFLGKKKKQKPVILQLPKNIGVIQISNDLTSVERKIMNVILWNATIIEKNNIFNQSKTMIKDDRKYYQISFYDIEEALEWGCYKNRSNILGSLENLVTTSLKFNVLGTQKTNHGKWNIVTSLLSSVISSQESSSIFYSFSDPIKDFVVRPTLYANLNLEMQKKIDSKYTLALWEYLVGEIAMLKVSDKSEDKLTQFYSSQNVTQYISIEDYREMVAGLDYNTNGAFKDINRELIKNPLKELTTKQIIKARPEYKKKGRKVTDVRFAIDNNYDLVESLLLVKKDSTLKANSDKNNVSNQIYKESNNTVQPLEKDHSRIENKAYYHSQNTNNVQTSAPSAKDKINLIIDEQNEYKKTIINNLLITYSVSELKRSEILQSQNLNYIEANIKYIIDNPEYFNKQNKAPLIIAAIKENYANYSDEAFELDNGNNDNLSEEMKIASLIKTLRIMVNPYVKNTKFFLRDQIRDYRIYIERKDIEGRLKIESILKKNLTEFLRITKELESKIGLDAIIKSLHLQSEEEMWKKLFITKDDLHAIALELNCYNS